MLSLLRFRGPQSNRQQLQDNRWQLKDNRWGLGDNGYLHTAIVHRGHDHIGGARRTCSIAHRVLNGISRRLKTTGSHGHRLEGAGGRGGPHGYAFRRHTLFLLFMFVMRRSHSEPLPLQVYGLLKSVLNWKGPGRPPQYTTRKWFVRRMARWACERQGVGERGLDHSVPGRKRGRGWGGLQASDVRMGTKNALRPPPPPANGSELVNRWRLSASGQLLVVVDRRWGGGGGTANSPSN